MKPSDILLDEETLFKSEEVFTPSYVPEDYIHRDDQLKELSLSLKPGLRGVNTVNTLLHGPPGTGKTTAVKHLFSEVNKISSKLVTVYVNCDDYNTRFGIFSRIHEAVYGHSPPDTGKPLNSVKEKIFKKLTKDNKSLVIALDEIDQLFLNKTIDKLLLDLLKAYTTYGYDKVGIIGMLIDDSVMLDLEPKISSIFNPVKIYFPSYSREEVEDILGTRIKYGFYDGVFSPKVFDYVVERTVEAGDLRVGIDLLRQSALLAERDASRKITLEHAELAFERESKSVVVKRAVSALDDLEKTLLKMIAKDNGIVSGVLTEKLKDETGTGIKKYNQLISKLEHIGLIESIAVSGRGQSRTLNLKHSPSEILKNL